MSEKQQGSVFAGGTWGRMGEWVFGVLGQKVNWIAHLLGFVGPRKFYFSISEMQ